MGKLQTELSKVDIGAVGRHGGGRAVREVYQNLAIRQFMLLQFRRLEHHYQDIVSVLAQVGSVRERCDATETAIKILREQRSIVCRDAEVESRLSVLQVGEGGPLVVINVLGASPAPPEQVEVEVQSVHPSFGGDEY